MPISIVGKQSFVSKKGVQCNILHVLVTQQGVEGYAAQTLFVSEEIYNKVSVRASYNVIYGAYANGRAFVQDLVPVNHE